MGHTGLTRIKSIIRSYIYWPGMDKEYKDAVKLCRYFAMAAKGLSVKMSENG